MPPLDLRSFVDRAAALADTSPPTTTRETRTWLVDPFLETLGWDPAAGSCLRDRTVEGVRLEYVPTVDSVPALFVAVESFDDALAESRANALRNAMAWTGVDRAIYTNGRNYLFLAGSTDVRYRALECAELVDAESDLANYSRVAIGRRLEGRSREHVARRLAVERESLRDAIVDRLADATGRDDGVADGLESATDRFLDRLVVAFADDESGADDAAADVSVQFSESSITDGRRPGDGDGSGRRSGSDTAGRSTSSESRDGAAGGDEPDATAADTRPESAPRGDDPDEKEDGEYVVRFFNDRGSIGAIGHSTSRAALVAAAEYLLERGLADVEVPWSPDDADGTVLNDAPTRADGSPMAAPERLSNGFHLATAGTVDDRAARVEALAARAGLRAMIAGDWGSD
jgi:hypothetical protein